jgi:hypothetical protein
MGRTIAMLMTATLMIITMKRKISLMTISAMRKTGMPSSLVRSTQSLLNKEKNPLRLKR